MTVDQRLQKIKAETPEAMPSEAMRLSRGVASGEYPPKVVVDSKVVVAVPFSWDVNTRPFTESIMRLAAAYPNLDIINVEGGDHAEMRMEAVRQAEALGAHELMFIDADMHFSPDDFGRLYQSYRKARANGEIAVFSGLCRARRKPFAPRVWNKVSRSFQLAELPMLSVDPVQYDGVGAAFMLVPMDVFALMNEPFFLKTNDFGEDLFFCDKLNQLGIPIYVDLHAKIGHVTLAIITSDPQNNPIALMK